MLKALGSARFQRSPAFLAPQLHLFDPKAHVQVHEDFPDAIGLTSLLTSLTTTNVLVKSIWHDLGSSLQLFHTWASETEQASLRADIRQNEAMRKLRYSATYESFIDVLEKFPDALDGCRKTLEDIRDMAMRELNQGVLDEASPDWGLIHGDFWTGKYVLSTVSYAFIYEMVR
jgi:fructosamine-3-kinase